MESSAPRKLSKKEKISYGVGQLPGGFYQSFTGQIQAFYYTWMGLNVFYILIAQILYAIWNVVNDPVFGVLQDRTRTEKGRYIPWIKWFSPVFVAAFISIFLIPNEWRFAYGGENTQLLVFWWYLISQLFYDLGFTIVYLAHAALLPQITSDFKERTEISVLGVLFGAIGMFVSGLFPLIFLTNPTADKILGLKICVIIFGLLSIIPWIMICTFLRERMELIPKVQESFWKNIKYVFKNPACRIYMIYDGVTVGISVGIGAAITFILPWTLGLDNPYGGSVTFIDIIPYFIFPVICIAFGAWLQMWVPKKKDLKTVLVWDFLFMLVGFLIAFFGALPSPTQSDSVYQAPPNIWLVSIGLGIALLGFLGNFIYLNPLNADVVDYDEILTGNRRESVYSGVNCVVSKPMYSVILILIPLILTLYGLVPASPNDPTSAALVVRSGFRNAITGVAIASFLLPAILAAIGLVVFIRYPLNGKKVAEIRKCLDEKHEKQRFDYCAKK